jgi:hypothetical protein
VKFSKFEQKKEFGKEFEKKKNPNPFHPSPFLYSAQPAFLPLARLLFFSTRKATRLFSLSFPRSPRGPPKQPTSPATSPLFFLA